MSRHPPRPPLDEFFDLSLDPLWISTLDGHFRRVNPAFIAALGHPENDLLGRNMLDFIHPDDRPAAAAALAVLAHGSPAATLESRFSCAGGSSKWLAWTSTPLPSEGLAYTVAHDLTRRRLDREALRQSEAQRACAMECSSDAIFTLDRAFRLTGLNQQAERLWNRTRHDILGRNLWDVFPEAVGGPFFKLYERVMRSGKPGHLEEWYPHAPHNRWFEVRAYPRTDGLAVYFRDSTGRRQAEEKIKRAFEEKEVLLREVHHRVKNNLQVVCSMLRLQERQLTDDTLLQVLRECRERVMAMAMLHDQLHRARDFSNLNLGEYIRNLAASLFCSYGVNSTAIGLQMEIEDIPVAVDTAIPCGLIVNELVANALRHAFPDGRKGCISLGLHARPGGSVELMVADDGCGFPNSAHTAKGRTLGLWLVDLLASQLGAAVERSHANGTRYRLLLQDAVAPAPAANPN